MPETKQQYSKVAVEKPAATGTINTTTKVQSLFPAEVHYTGQISGQQYVFVAGQILEVDSRDVPDMLAYRIGTTNCCGGGNLDGNKVFQIL